MMRRREIVTALVCAALATAVEAAAGGVKGYSAAPELAACAGGTSYVRDAAAMLDGAELTTNAESSAP
jgi:hypothetical protein